jgi:preprotein translocase subunit SecG
MKGPKEILIIVQILVCLFLGALILLQTKGTGLGKSFGASGTSFSTKRGMEKTIFWLTVFLTLLFILSSLTQIVIF